MEIEDLLYEKHRGDSKQLELIFSEEPRIVVTAPAGCGKTTTMVSKIVRELCSGRIHPGKKVLAMTFSVNAAIKIKESVNDILPEFVLNPDILISKVDIANYHQFSIKMLYKYGFALCPELKKLGDYVVVGDTDNRMLYLLSDSEKDVIKKFTTSLENADAKGVSELIDAYWNIQIEKLFTNQLITYNGIIVAALKLLENSVVADFYKKYYSLVIVDEFQDTNILGAMLIKNLMGDNQVIFLGDNIQKIYGFLGAVEGILGLATESFSAREIVLETNYRFINNERMKALDLFIRDYAEKYSESDLCAEAYLKVLESDEEENKFIVSGIKQMLCDGADTVAILMRAGWQGLSLAKELDKEWITYFNALYSEQDVEYIRFYKVAIEEYQKCVKGKAVRVNLNECLKNVKNRELEVYEEDDRSFVFKSLYSLLEKLFEQSFSWHGTSQERYEKIAFTLYSNGLKHMLEYIDEKIVLTTIHSAKGLEWDYVIIPQMNSHVFPSSKYVCKLCKSNNGCKYYNNRCILTFNPDMYRLIKDEFSIFYVAVTRAKKEVFLTANIGKNNWGFDKKTNCMVNLKGLSQIDYTWDEVLSTQQPTTPNKK